MTILLATANVTNVPFDLEHILSATIILFVILDVIGTIPVFLSLQESGMKISPGKVTLATMLFLVVFLFTGEWILRLFHVEISSFAAAGGIVVFIISLEMVFGIKFFNNEQSSGDAVSVVPVAFPLIAGPGTLTTVLSIRAEYAVLNILVAILLNVTLVYLVIKNLKWFRRVLGPAGIFIMRRFFGIILMAIAVKLFTSNIASLVGGAIK
ncbi:MAG: MarC family protein [Planctomycetaceae bacterium]|jgi:multiple antibiotic resistance protein|nr:MarC family protein [Planctomycetaceae bacterium]